MIASYDVDTAAQRAAANPAQSVWVSANAGAGKTTMLVNRIVRLLLDGTAPGRILCLTFTKAAAAEMAERLSRELGRWAVANDDELHQHIHKLLGRDPPAGLGPARRLFARAIETPGGLKIQTIHAFCESLLARFPLEAGISPHFSVMDERTADELMGDVRDRLFSRAHIQGPKALAQALDQMAGLVSEAGFNEVMRELIFNQGRLARMLGRYGGRKGLLLAVHQALGLEEGDTRATVLTAAANGAIDEQDLMSAGKALMGSGKNDQKRGQAIVAFLEEDTNGRVRTFDSYLSAFLTVKKEPLSLKKLAAKAVIEANPSVLDVLSAEQVRLLDASKRLNAAAVCEATKALLIIGEALIAAYQQAKDSRALADYNDLILGVRNLLAGKGRVAWVLYKLDGGLDHILVDEAQDTSPEQWEIIEALASEFFAGLGARPEHRTLFVVGDEKQSIYSFQGADPEGFSRMYDGFAARADAAGLRLASVEIGLSFRSTWAILSVVDAVFGQSGGGQGLTFKGRAIRHLSSRDGQAGLVELWAPMVHAEEQPEDPWDSPTNRMPDQDPAARLAERIADTIRGWLDSGEILKSRNRPIREGDIMILLRKRSQFAQMMVKALKDRNIRVAGADRMVLTDQLAVMDLMALGRFALLPEDDFNTAVTFKGPLVGLNEDDLFRLAWNRKGTLWDALRASADFAAQAEFLADLRARADYAPPYEFFARLLGPGQGRKKLLARLGPDAGDPIDEFLALALAYGREHVPSLQGFLQWVQAGQATIKRNLEHGHGEVRVMTIHGAKGLQADVVFLPDTCTLPARQKDPRLRWRADEDESVVFWPVHRGNEGELSLKLLKKAHYRQEEEYRRLLYVAMTRARDRLYICGWEAKRGRSQGCWYDLASAVLKRPENKIELPSGITAWRVATPQDSDPDGLEKSAEQEPPPPPLPAWVQAMPPAEPKPPRPLAPSRPEDDAPPVRSPLGPDEGARFKRGRIVHRLLQILPDLEPERRAEAARAYLARTTLGLREAIQEEIAAQVMAVLNAKGFAHLFGPNSMAEVPLVGTVADQVISAQVDRLVVNSDSITVADYKTHQSPPRTVKDVPSLYLRQMAAYRAVLSHIYADRPVYCVLLWTDGPHLMEIPLPLLDAYAP